MSYVRLVFAVAALIVTACPPPKVRSKPEPPATRPAAPVTVTAAEIIEKATDGLSRPGGVDTLLASLFAVNPDHLEGRVVAARAREAAKTDATAAWRHVEQIIVVNGKLEPFVRRENLLAAARHYLARGAQQRAALFLEALWRRFPHSDAAARAQLMVAEQGHRDRRWADVRDACRELARVQPRHAANARCKTLAAVANRLERIGGLAAREGPRWRWETPRPQANDLEGLWMGPKGILVAVGHAGTIVEAERARPLRWVPRVTRWSLFGVHGASKARLYAVGEGGVVLARRDGRWSVLRAPRPERSDLRGVFSPRPDELWAVGDGGIIEHYLAGRWRSFHPTKQRLHAIWGRADRLWAVGDEGALLTFEGGAWRSLSSDAYENLRGVAGHGSDGLLMVGDRRTVAYFDGRRSKESVEGLVDLRSVWVDSRRNAFAVGMAGQILRNDGRPLAGWRRERSPTAMELRAVAGDGRGRVVAVGAGGTVVERRGGRWRLLAGGVSQLMVDVRCIDKECWALGSRGRLAARVGGAWRVTHLPVSGTYHALWRDARQVVAVGARGLMVVGDGRAFRKVDVGTPEDLHDVAVCDGRIVAVGGRGVVVEVVSEKARVSRTPTGHTLRAIGCKPRIAVGERGTIVAREGARWKLERSGTLRDLGALWTSEQGAALAAGSGGTILRRGARGWRRVPAGLSQPFVGIWGRSARDLYAVSRYGKVVHFDGSGWSEQRSPAACLTAVSGNAKGAWAVGCSGGVITLGRGK